MTSRMEWEHEQAAKAQRDAIAAERAARQAAEVEAERLRAENITVIKRAESSYVEGLNYCAAQYKAQMDLFREMREERNKIRAERDRLAEALRWYASEKAWANWKWNMRYECDAIVDQGKRARKTLKELGLLSDEEGEKS